MGGVLEPGYKPYVDDPDFVASDEMVYGREALPPQSSSVSLLSGRPDRVQFGPNCSTASSDSSGNIHVDQSGSKDDPGLTCHWPVVGPKREHRWTNRLLVVPKLKFAFCYIEKNACTQFNILINRLNGIRASPGTTVFMRSSHEALGIPFEDITPENGWRKAIFLRDPSERFLSAWRSKCVEWENEGRHCFGGERVRENDTNSVVANFEKVVKTHLLTYRRLRDNTADGTYNAHYDPQTRFCGGEPLESYSFVGRLVGEPLRVHSQVTDMLTKVAQAPPRLLRRAGVDTVFPVHRKLGHHTDTSETLVQSYSNPDVYDMVRSAFAEDYRLSAAPQIRKVVSVE
jgi:hypothetical protein